MNNSSNHTKINIKSCVGILWASLFPILNLFMSFGFTYHPISRHPVEKDIFAISSYIIVVSWSIICIIMTIHLVCAVAIFSLWLAPVPLLVGGFLYKTHLTDWRISYKESLDAFRCKNILFGKNLL